LRLGIIGISEGNGHPYSWAAIFNGYDQAAMASCPFPSIPEYLAARCYPDDFLTSGRVTHVWTQERVVSEHIAAAARIETVVDAPEDMLGEVDAVLLARDDARHHRDYARPFLQAGVPIYIDKPLAVERKAALELLGLSRGERYLYSCSALRFARELSLAPEQRAALGRLTYIDARVPKYWSTYAVHAIEPVLCQFAETDAIREHVAADVDGGRQLTVEWKSGVTTRFTATGSAPTPIEYTVYGERGTVTLRFRDSFAAFRAALERFVQVASGDAPNIPREFLLKVVDVIELGCTARGRHG
jgi:predicted dehydrogenase